MFFLFPGAISGRRTDGGGSKKNQGGKIKITTNQTPINPSRSYNEHKDQPQEKGFVAKHKKSGGYA